MAAEWTHSICAQCWYERNPDRDPVTLRFDLERICCFCSAPTTAGIYVREDPQNIQCLGFHSLLPKG